MPRPCLRCEPEQSLFSQEKIASLAAQIKMEPSLAADENVYADRLAACKTCEALREDVLCFHCGCFVFIRARSSVNYCPHPGGDRWFSL